MTWECQHNFLPTVYRRRKCRQKPVLIWNPSSEWKLGVKYLSYSVWSNPLGKHHKWVYILLYLTLHKCNTALAAVNGRPGIDDCIGTWSGPERRLREKGAEGALISTRCVASSQASIPFLTCKITVQCSLLQITMETGWSEGVYRQQSHSDKYYDECTDHNLSYTLPLPLFPSPISTAYSVPQPSPLQSVMRS